PKFGVTWNPFPDTTVRAAAFRVLKKTLVADQTIEPTQVAGFNQFFDDNNGTDAWRYGGAIDQKFTKDIFGGAEFSMRDLTVPLVGTLEVDWEEYLGRAYAFWTPHPWLALRGEYIFERLKLVEIADIDTHRVPLGINVFHPAGLSGTLTATYWNQDVDFADSRSGRDDFVTVDAGVSYRLPKRYGFITVGAANLFDEEFDYFNYEFNNPTIQPDRMVFARITLQLP
ncbi:MAG: TonB-dependent receptor, partial [Anaerolineae bacterium]|nr:TonB-dependent receptor [Anaerolineae bacterium]